MQTSLGLGESLPSETYTAQGDMLKIIGKHSMKFGGEYRLMQHATFGLANGQGTYAFTRSWTSSNPQVNDPNSGNAIASFLLGDMSSASANLNSRPYLSSPYPLFSFHFALQLYHRLPPT